MPYLSKGGDKTSSWVDSLSNEPPLPVPIAETVLDPVPNDGANLNDQESPSADEDIRLRIAGRRGPKRDKERADRDRERDRERDRDRERKHHRRRSIFEGAPRGYSDEERDPREKKSRRKSYAQPEQYAEPPVRTWDGRPAENGGGKRQSWFKKIF